VSAISADLYGGNPSCPASTSTGSPTFRSTISKSSSHNLGKTTTTSTTMHPQQATVDFQTGAMTAPVPMSFQVNKKQLSLKHGIFACNVCDVIFARHSILPRRLEIDNTYNEIIVITILKMIKTDHYPAKLQFLLFF
jgi:hypothetical protein